MVEHFLEPLFLVYFAVVIAFLSGLYFVIKGHLKHKEILKARRLLVEGRFFNYHIWTHNPRLSSLL